MSVSTTVHLQRCLQRLAENDLLAQTELLTYVQKRLSDLTDRMFQQFRSLQFREQSEDLVQEAIIRLWKSLEEVGPITVDGFMRLAESQMRLALCDLARTYSGKNLGLDSAETVSSAGDHAVDPAAKPVIDDTANASDELACWSEFHHATDELPEPCHTVVDLLYYHELPQFEVASLMGISERQVQRHWNLARVKLSKKLDGLWPEV